MGENCSKHVLGEGCADCNNTRADLVHPENWDADQEKVLRPMAGKWHEYRPVTQLGEHNDVMLYKTTGRPVESRSGSAPKDLFIYQCTYCMRIRVEWPGI